LNFLLIMHLCDIFLGFFIIWYNWHNFKMLVFIKWKYCQFFYSRLHYLKIWTTIKTSSKKPSVPTTISPLTTISRWLMTWVYTHGTRPTTRDVSLFWTIPSCGRVLLNSEEEFVLSFELSTPSGYSACTCTVTKEETSRSIDTPPGGLVSTSCRLE